MSPHQLFPHLRGFRLVAIRHESEENLLVWESTRSSAPCPVCRQRSTQIHSRYSRTIRDLPLHLTSVILQLLVHKFFCHNPACERKIFTERLPDLATPHAQHTLALQRWLCAVGVAIGGEAGARLARQQGITVTGRTLLRLVHQMSLPPYPPPRKIGLDDFAWKRRFRYGAIVVDLERSRVIALLPDRSVPTVVAWLERHPTINIVARDRSHEFAAAISQALPHAQQVADRFHIVQNLLEYMDRLVTRRWKALQHRIPARFPRDPGQEEAMEQRRATGDAQYRQVLAYHLQGWSASRIARTLGLTARTVSRWIKQGHGPRTMPRRRHPSQLDPYLPYLCRQWKRGKRDPQWLWRKIRARGYPGSIRMVYRVVATLQTEAPPAARSHPLTGMTARQVVGWLMRDPASLSHTETQHLRQALSQDALLEQAYHLIVSFRRMIRERSGAELNQWLTQARQTGIPEFRQFAQGVERDKAAVEAGLTLPYSTGPVEGHIHRLKLLKRQSYGRAGLDLLARRIMAAA